MFVSNSQQEAGRRVPKRGEDKTPLDTEVESDTKMPLPAGMLLIYRW